MRKALVSVLVVMMCLASASVFAAGNKYVVGVSFDTINHPYWKSDIAGMQAAAKELGVELKILNAQGDVNAQNHQIENLLASKVQAVICIAADNKAVLQSVKKCNQANVPFIWNDRQVFGTADAKVSYGVGTDNVALAKNGVQWIADYARKNNLKLKVLILLGPLTDNNAIERDKGYSAAIDANSDVLDLVAKVPAGWDEAKSLAATVNSLQAHPEINCILMPADLQLPAVESGLKQYKRWVKEGQPGHVVLGALNGDKVALDAVKDGYEEVVMCQPIIDTGRLTVQAAVDLINGKKLDENGQLNPGFLVYKENFNDKAYDAYGYFGMKK